MPLPQRRNFALGYHTRRSFLKMVGRAGLAAASVVPRRRSSGRQLSRPNPDEPTLEGQPLIQPQQIRSENGVLRTTITAAPKRVQLGNFLFPGLLYNGAYLPPLLRPRLGDTMRIT